LLKRRPLRRSRRVDKKWGAEGGGSTDTAETSEHPQKQRKRQRQKKKKKKGGSDSDSRIRCMYDYTRVQGAE
jgi:hypothetical protein